MEIVAGDLLLGAVPVRMCNYQQPYSGHISSPPLQFSSSTTGLLLTPIAEDGSLNQYAPWARLSISIEAHAPTVEKKCEV